MKTKFLKYLIPLLTLSLIGLLTIYMSKSTISNYYSYFYRQIIYLIIGLVLLFIMKNINFAYIKKYSLIFYMFSIILLIYVLLFGNTINGSKSWINLFGISIQPSEFAKISLLLCIDLYIETKYGLLKSIIMLIIPSILTFMQPDTGTVLFYIIIFFSIFLSLKLKKRYYISLFSLAFIIVSLYFYLYFFKSDLFIKLFGTSFFYRTDRIINFLDNEGYQINNALLGIGNGGIFGNGSKYIVYIPEAITDFMFANILMIWGFVGGIIVIINYIYIDF